jgi:hypothetical protein
VWLQIGPTTYQADDIDLRRQFLDCIGEGEGATVVAPFLSVLTHGWVLSTEKLLPCRGHDGGRDAGEAGVR